MVCFSNKRRLHALFRQITVGCFGISLLLLSIGCSKQTQNLNAQTNDDLSDAQQSFEVLNKQNSNGFENYSAVTSDGYGAIASVNPHATQAGLDAFKKGGNAIDAAIAVALTLGVVDSHNSGIGGGCFILVRDASGKVLAIDAREMAPAAAYEDMYIRDGKVDSQASKTGAQAIGIPGSLLGYEYLANNLGKLPFSSGFEHGIMHASNGFKVQKVLAARMKRLAPKLSLFESTASIYLKAKGDVFLEGDRLVQSDLAATYDAISQQGSSYFYGGDFAKKTEKWMKENNGLITIKDFKNYKLKFREPVVSTFNDYTILGFPPPSSGGVHVAQILNILEHFDIAGLPKQERYHVIAQAMKLAFADRAHWMGDPDFTKVPKGLASDSYAAQLAKKISLDSATSVDKYSTPADSATNFYEQLNKHTTHIATADKDGNWVAITTTLNTSFGSKVTIPGTGVLMNNQMDDFSADIGKPNAFGLIGAKANSIEPGKRPLSSMSPTIVIKDGKPLMTLGAAGGPTIISQVVQTITNHLLLKMPLKDAIAAPRIHHQWRPDRLVVEGAVSKDVQKSLEKKGHKIKRWNSFGATQAIELKDGKFTAVSEPRIQ